MLKYYENYIKGKYLYSRLDKNLCKQKDENYEFRKEIVDYVYNYETDAHSKELLNFLPLVLFLYKNKNDIAFTNEKGDIYLNPNRFRGEISSIEEWEFIFCHECYHQVWDTFDVQKCIGKELGRCYPKVLNVASDCIINETLKASKRKVPTMVITAETIKRDFDVDYEIYDTQYSLYIKIINSDIFKQKQKEAEERKQQQQQQQQNGQQGQQGQQDQQDQEGNENQQGQGGNQQGQDENQGQGQGQGEDGNESQQQGGGKQQGKQGGKQGGKQQGGKQGSKQQGGNKDDDESGDYGEEPLTNDDSLFDYEDYSKNGDGEGDEDGEDDGEQSGSGNGKKSDKDSDNKNKKGREDGEDEDGDGDGDEDGDGDGGKDSDKSDKNGENKDAQGEDGNEGKGDKNSQGQEDGDGQGQGQEEDGDGQGQSQGEDGEGGDKDGQDGEGNGADSEEGGDGIGKSESDKEIGDGDIISDEELRKVHKQAIEICQNAVTGMMKDFVGKCKSSTRLEKPKRKQVKIGQNFGGSNGSWDDKLLTTVLKFMDQRLNNNINPETKRSWGKINKNMIDFHKKYGKDILIPGRKKEEKKLYVKFAFFIDASGSMRNGRIDGASLAANAIADVVDNRYGDKIKKINNQNKKNKNINNINNKKKEEEEEIHDFYAFYDERIGIKKIKRRETPITGGSTMSYVNLFKNFKKYGTDCLVNIIFTDAEQPFMPKDKEFLESFINSNDGLIVYLACTQHNRKMLEWLAEKNKGKFYYILSDNDFFVENDTLINSRNKLNESIFNVKRLDFIPLFEEYFYKE